MSDLVAWPSQKEARDCQTDSDSVAFFVLQIEEAKTFLHESISASSELFRARSAFLCEVLGGFAEPALTDSGSLVFSFRFLSI